MEKSNPTVLSVESEYSKAPESQLISISRINDGKCPFGYFKNYIETPKQEKPFLSIELGLGNFFHERVAALFRRIQTESPDAVVSKNDGLVKEILLKDFRKKFLVEGKLVKPYKIIKSDDSFSTFERRLSGIIDNFNKFTSKELVGHRIVSVEGKLQITTFTCLIRGITDLITEKSNQHVLWDWKTGKEPNPRFMDSYEPQKKQITIYSTWMRHTYESENVKGSSVYLRGKLTWLSEMYDAGTEAEVLKYMVGWRNKLNQLLVYPQKGSALCRWCPWNKECSNKQSERPF